jgi:hypothetical protein
MTKDRKLALSLYKNDKSMSMVYCTKPSVARVDLYRRHGGVRIFANVSRKMGDGHIAEQFIEQLSPGWSYRTLEARLLKMFEQIRQEVERQKLVVKLDRICKPLQNHPSFQRLVRIYGKHHSIWLDGSGKMSLDDAKWWLDYLKKWQLPSITVVRSQDRGRIYFILKTDGFTRRIASTGSYALVHKWLSEHYDNQPLALPPEHPQYQMVLNVFKETGETR